jgi:pimeloyl-ACP methyl ester carboxylesterase
MGFHRIYTSPSRRRMVDRFVVVSVMYAAMFSVAAMPSRGLAQDSPALAVPPEAADYAVAHQRVDIGHGRRLNLYCRGRGEPTVIFDGGTGEQSWDWRYVQPSVGRATRACVYDRAGYGFSDPPTRPGTAANAVDDLHSLVKAADLKMPLILVGHSYGGLVSQLYAYTYPREVGGLVLVDTYHEDATARGDRTLNGKISEFHKEMTAYFEGCRTAVHAGLHEGSKAWDDCVGDEAAVYGAVLWPIVRDQHRSVTHVDAIGSERDNEDGATAEQLRAARKSFGDLPLVYLTRGISPYMIPGKPQSAANKAYEDEMLKSHDEIAALSTRGVDYIVPGAGHDIHLEKPQAVIDAVLAIVVQAH